MQFSKCEGASLTIKKFAQKLIGSKVWYSGRCTLVWKVVYGLRSRTYINLQASRSLFSRSLLPTASEGEIGKGRPLTVIDGKVYNLSPKGSKYGVSLRQLAEQGFLPTPLASDASTGAIIGQNDQFKATTGLPRKVNKNGKDGGVGLARLVTLLAEPLIVSTGLKKQLNPMFVLEMMGFPVNWTLLPFMK